MQDSKPMWFSKAYAFWHEEGLFGAARRVKRWLWTCKEDLVLLRHVAKSQDAAPPTDITFRVAAPEDVPWLAEQMPHLGPAGEERVREQMRDGDVTVVGSRGPEGRDLVFSAWISHHGLDLELLGDAVRDGEGSVRRVWVPHAHRRKGIAQMGMRHLESVVMGRGVERLWSLVSTDNETSLRLHARLGYQPFGRIRMVRRFGRRYALVRQQDRRRWRRHRLPKWAVKL